MSTLNVNLQYPSHPNIRERKYNSGVIQAEFRFNVLRVQKKKKITQYITWSPMKVFSGKVQKTQPQG